MRRLLALIVLSGVAAVAWQNRSAIRSFWDEIRGIEVSVPSPALAEAAQAKLAGLTEPRGPRRVVLSEAEVQSLVQYRMASLLPSYVAAPQIELGNSRIRLLARVATERFPQVEELGDMVGFLPDTTEVSAAGQLIPLDQGRVGFAVDEISAAKIPLPRGLIPKVLQRLGRRDEPGLPPDALALPLPAGASAAYIRGDSLVLVTRARETD